MIEIIVIAILVVAFVIIRLIASQPSDKVPVVFAGVPTNEAIEKQIAHPQNEPVFKLKGETVSMAGLEKFIISGHSLEPLGIKDKSIVYVHRIKNIVEISNLNKLDGRFVILNIDNNRTIQEHPLKDIVLSEGKKARKVVNILAIDEIDYNIGSFFSENILSNDKDYNALSEQQREAYLNKIIQKYVFARNYYEDEQHLILSITYKNGIEKDYSFHSLKFLYGTIDYVEKT